MKSNTTTMKFQSNSRRQKRKKMRKTKKSSNLQHGGVNTVHMFEFELPQPSNTVTIPTDDLHLTWPIDWSLIDEAYLIQYGDSSPKTYCSKAIYNLAMSQTFYVVIQSTFAALTRSIGFKDQSKESSSDTMALLDKQEHYFKVSIVYAMLLAYMTRFPFALSNPKVTGWMIGKISKVLYWGPLTAGCAVGKILSNTSCLLFDKVYNFMKNNKLIDTFGKTDYVDGIEEFNIIFSKLLLTMYNLMVSSEDLTHSGMQVTMETYLNIEKITICAVKQYPNDSTA